MCQSYQTLSPIFHSRYVSLPPSVSLYIKYILYKYVIPHTIHVVLSTPPLVTYPLSPTRCAGY